MGSNNPDVGKKKKNKDENGIPLDGIPFHPYYTVKDFVGIGVFLFLFALVVFFWIFSFFNFISTNFHWNIFSDAL